MLKLKVVDRPSFPTGVLMALALALCASAFSRPASAQDAQPAAASTQPATARQIDEYGAIGHCDMTAHLDNFAIELQTNPSAKAVLVGYDAKGQRQGRASWYLRVGRFYLINVRGIDASRVAAVESGSRDAQDVTTELWLVPEGAEPPLAPASDDKYTAKDFSGKFNTYTTDELIYREQIEMGWSGADISHSEFAGKLKQQPDSLGYLVIRTSKKSLPGTWRRIARREQQFITKDYGIEARRLASVYGGQADGDLAEVALWILPKSAAPPEGAKEPAGEALRQAVRLHRLDSYGESVDEAADGWMLEGIAEALRENPRAVVSLIWREPEPMTYEGEETDAAAEADPAESQDESQDESADDSIKAWAEDWKKTLTTKYGIYPWRVVIVEGKRMPWGAGRLSAWLVPENARWPDPLAPDADEVEESEGQESAGAAAKASESSATPPR